MDSSDNTGKIIRVAKVKVYGNNSPADGKKEDLDKEMAKGN
jgi:hypothetical protein